MVHRTDGVGTLGSRTPTAPSCTAPCLATSNEQLARHPIVSPRLSGHVRTKKSTQKAAFFRVFHLILMYCVGIIMSSSVQMPRNHEEHLQWSLLLRRCQDLTSESLENLVGDEESKTSNQQQLVFLVQLDEASPTHLCP